ncbi:MAG: tetratricopeptide repeat protein [Pseudomonadota bacterium]
MEQPTSVFTFLLVLIAIGLAWAAGYRSRFHPFPGLKRSQQQDYFVGLNYLLNDEPDDAIDVFIEALEVNSDTLATHLALGTLLRRRGKVDRSISHYQQLLDSNSFSGREQSEIKIQLVRSFISAGLLDRAERLLEDLMNTPPALKEVALGLAITVFQKEKEWQKALAAATELQKICSPHRRQEIQLQASHYHCELADMKMKAGELEPAREELKKALQICRHNVRIYLMTGRLESLAGAPKEAVKALLKVAQFDPSFAHEASEELRLNLQRSGLERQITGLMDEGGEISNESRHILDSVAGIARQQGEDEALNFLLPQLRARPSLSLLAQSLALAVRREPKTQAQVLELGSSLLGQHLANSPHYRCDNCGFELKSMHWLCPGCSRWGMVKPLDDRISYNHENLTTPS